MDEYISREALLTEIAADYGNWTACNDTDESYSQGVKDNYNDTIRLINDIPAADVQPVRYGRWILSDDKNWLMCSFCGAYFDVSCGAPFFYVDNDEVSHINFCPNCGYKQDLDGGDING